MVKHFNFSVNNPVVNCYDVQVDNAGRVFILCSYSTHGGFYRSKVTFERCGIEGGFDENCNIKKICATTADRFCAPCPGGFEEHTSGDFFQVLQRDRNILFRVNI